MSTLIISDYLENKLIDHVLRDAAYTDPDIENNMH